MATKDGSLVLTASQHELDQVLEEDGDVAALIHDEVKRGTMHRTQLWKYRTGRDRPGPDMIGLFARLSEGRIAAEGWEKGTLPRRASKPKRAAAGGAR